MIFENTYSKETAVFSIPTNIREDKNLPHCRSITETNHPPQRLVQDLNFPDSCQRLKLSRDRLFLFGCGLHSPRIRCYELSQLGMKFERKCDSEIIEFQILSDDYSKIVCLCKHRSIIVQARYGTHSILRIPREGRDIAYLPFTACLVVVGSTAELNIISLAEGRFLTPINSRSPCINTCCYSPVHGLFACGGEKAILECFDMRAQKSVGYTNVARVTKASGEQLTSLRYGDDGLHVAAGTSSGSVIVYDLRSSHPLIIKDHMYKSAIIDIKIRKGFAHGTPQKQIISSDVNIVKVWGLNDDKLHISIQPPKEAGRINDICVWPQAGLVMLGMESPDILPYFVPSLGPAPQWCSFLEDLTERVDLEAYTKSQENYKFLSRKDATKLGLFRTRGLRSLKAFMHGFLVDKKTYNSETAAIYQNNDEINKQKKIQEYLNVLPLNLTALLKPMPCKSS